VAGHNVAQVIGQSVAVHLAQLLAPFMEAVPGMLASLAERVQQRDACLMCASRVKAAGREYDLAVTNANAAAEPPPPEPDLRVAHSFTTGARGPVCWPCYDPGKDGPYDMAEYLPPSVD
jgi:hypothetical protein